MKCQLPIRCSRWQPGGFVLLMCLAACSVTAADEARSVDQPLAAILKGEPPAGLEELRAMQARVRDLSERVLHATVAVHVGSAQGSGVLVSADGFVMTAAHVIGKSGRLATVYLQDGRRFTAQTLGTYRTLDAGLLKIDQAADNAERFPFLPLGDSSRLALGQWCLATGHPGGLQPALQPTLRLGRILTLNQDTAVTTDCTLIGGDSGGPLLDLDGKIIGIHSRIGPNLTANLHVPVNAYRETWDRLRQGENWGYLPGRKPFLGVQGEAGATDARLSRVFPESPAEKAGLAVGDVVIQFGDEPITDFDSLQRQVEATEPGTHVKVAVLRGGRRVVFDMTVGRRAGD